MNAYNTNQFREVGHQLIDQLADHLDSCKAGAHPVLRLISPNEEYAFWKNYKLIDANQFFKDIINRNIHVHHKNYIGHQVSAPAPLAALAGLVSNLMNDGMGIYEMGAAGTAIEIIVIEEFTKALGYPDDANGVLTSGGTLANLTALLAARAHFRIEHPDATPFILVSNQAHFCIDRAAMTMGFSTEQVIKIDVDKEFRINTALLESKIENIVHTGGKIMAVVGCACSTATGSYDDIETLSGICKKYKIWLHVDGAHGGAAIFSKKYKYLCRGMSLADSVIVDAHKMMMIPALATAVLFRRPADSYRSLEIDASYLFENNEAEWHNLTKRTYETTKYMMCIKIFLLMRLYGLELFDSYLTTQYDLAKNFAKLISENDSFELAHNPMSNIVCFRYLKNQSNLDLSTKEIRKKMLENGKFYIVQTMLKGEYYLRVTIMSPYTSIRELKELLLNIEDVSRQIG